VGVKDFMNKSGQGRHRIITISNNEKLIDISAILLTIKKEIDFIRSIWYIILE